MSPYYSLKDSAHFCKHLAPRLRNHSINSLQWNSGMLHLIAVKIQKEHLRTPCSGERLASVLIAAKGGTLVVQVLQHDLLKMILGQSQRQQGGRVHQSGCEGQGRRESQSSTSITSAQLGKLSCCFIRLDVHLSHQTGVCRPQVGLLRHASRYTHTHIRTPWL